MHTHEIKTQGRKIRVRQTRPGYGVDDAGQEWPLFIGIGQRGYTIKAIGAQKAVARKRKASRHRAVDRAQSPEREAECAAQVEALKSEPNFGRDVC